MIHMLQSTFRMMTRRLLDLLLIAATSLILASGAAAQTDPGFDFNPNPPSKRHDYYSSAADAQNRLKVVEKYHWDLAIRHLEGGNYLQSHKNLDHILRYIPNHPHALERYSKLAIERGKPESALQYLDFAVQFSPDTVSTYIVYGIHRYRMEDYGQAAKRFRQALERDPERAEAHYNLGLALLEQGQYAEAREHAERAYELEYPLPGLRRRLERSGHWQTSDQDSQ
jgi:tetratricopeptide (TPR) repeat protein